MAKKSAKVAQKPAKSAALLAWMDSASYLGIFSEAREDLRNELGKKFDESDDERVMCRAADLMCGLGLDAAISNYEMTEETFREFTAGF